MINSDVTNISEHALGMASGAVNIRFLKGELCFKGAKGAITQKFEPGIENRLFVYIEPEVTSITGRMTDCDYVVIVGEANSAAEAYAAAQGYEFQAFGSSEPEAPGAGDGERDGFGFRVENGEITITGCSLKTDHLVIPETLLGFPVTKIAKGAIRGGLSGTAGVRSVSLPSELRTIESGAFSSWLHALDTVTVHEDNPYFCAEDGVLYNKNKTKLVMAMPAVKEILVPEGVEAIGEDAFSDCKMTKAILPDSMKRLEDGAFSGSRLKEITIPAGVTEIGARAFSGCKHYMKITFGEQIDSIGEGILD